MTYTFARLNRILW